MSTPVPDKIARPTVGPLSRLLDEKGEFARWHVLKVSKGDTSVPGATVRVRYSAPESTVERDRALVVGETIGWLEDVRRFLVANHCAVRYANDRLSLMVIDPTEKVEVDGKQERKVRPGIVLAMDRAVGSGPLPVPDHRRWNLMMWEKRDARMAGVRSTSDVWAAIEHSAQRGIPAVVGGDGSIWMGDMLFSPELTAPPMDVWRPYLIPAEYLRQSQHNESDVQRCAMALLPHRGRFREEFFDVPGAEPSRSREVEWTAAVGAVESALTMLECRVEGNGRGVVRVWHQGGGLMVRTPVAGTEVAGLPGLSRAEAQCSVAVEAAEVLAAAGYAGAVAGDWAPISGSSGFWVEGSRGDLVHIFLSVDGQLIGLPNRDTLAGWAETLNAAPGWRAGPFSGGVWAQRVSAEE
ncbi:hypothetical protein [Kitasatospora sp. NPDC088548]|uniref:hypothetical protein n=1 Tax=Kitasatospora sp. NPDC088548 TaxID=3364075 RepID=UPI003801F7DB